MKDIKHSIKKINQFIAGDYLEYLLLSFIQIILTLLIALPLLTLLSFILFQALFSLSPDFVLTHENKITVVMQSMNTFSFSYINISAPLFMLAGALYLIRVIPVLTCRIKVTDMVEIIIKKEFRNIKLINGSTVPRGTTIYDLHFGTMKSMLKHKKNIICYRQRLLYMREIQLLGFLKLIGEIKSENYSLSKGSVFRASSHLITDHIVKELGGIKPSKKENDPLSKALILYFHMVVLIILSNPLKAVRFKDLLPKKFIKKQTCYFYAQQLIDRETYIKAELEKCRELQSKITNNGHSKIRLEN